MEVVGKKQKWIYDLCLTACKAFLLDLRPPSAEFGPRGGAQLAISCSEYRVTVGSDTSFRQSFSFRFSPAFYSGGGGSLSAFCVVSLSKVTSCNCGSVFWTPQATFSNNPTTTHQMTPAWPTHPLGVQSGFKFH